MVTVTYPTSGPVHVTATLELAWSAWASLRPPTLCRPAYPDWPPLEGGIAQFQGADHEHGGSTRLQPPPADVIARLPRFRGSNVVFTPPKLMFTSWVAIFFHSPPFITPTRVDTRVGM